MPAGGRSYSSQSERCYFFVGCGSPAVRMAKAFVSVYMAAVVALVAAAIGIWRLRCEGFGCMGIGVAWFAWVVSFFVVLGVGLFARSKAASAASLAQAARVTWWFQLAVGPLAVAVWLSKSAA